MRHSRWAWVHDLLVTKFSERSSVGECNLAMIICGDEKMIGQVVNAIKWIGSCNPRIACCIPCCNGIGSPWFLHASHAQLNLATPLLLGYTQRNLMLR